MRKSIRGRIRGHLSTAAAAFSLIHVNMLRVALTLPRPRLRAYADAAFKLYMESRCQHIDFVELGDALRMLDVDPINIRATLIDLGGYRGRSDWERLFLASIAGSRRTDPIFEIGTAAGNTTVLLAANTDSSVYTLDLADSGESGPTLTWLGSDEAVRRSRKRAEFIKKNPHANIIELIGDSARFDYTGFRDRIGLFFIDGAHSVEYVESDTMNAAWCCRKDGIIVWDDFTTTRDVTNYIRGLKTSGVKLFGVRGTRLAFTQDIGRLREISRHPGMASGGISPMT